MRSVGFINLHGATLLALVVAFGMPMAATVAEETDFSRLCDAITSDPPALVPLLEQGADPNDANDLGHTALMIAADRGDAEAIAALLEHGAAVDQRTNYGRTALHIAAGQGRVKATDALLAAGADPNVQNKELSTPLIACIDERHPRLVPALLAAGADPNLADYYGMTPLHWSVRERFAHTAGLLIEAGAEVDARGTGGYTPLLIMREWDPAMFQLLVDAGADIDARTEYGLTLLHAACYSYDPHPETVRALLASGANPDLPSTPGYRFGMTPLACVVYSDLGIDNDWACDFGPPAPPDPTIAVRRLEVATMLLAAGADPDGRGSSPLPHAAYRGELSLVELLLQAGANPEGSSPEWHTPLMFAAEEGHLDCCKALVAAGANINRLNNDGANALSWAVASSQTSVVAWLLEAGANPSMGRVPYDYDELPLHFAQSNDRPEIAALLEAAMIDDH